MDQSQAMVMLINDDPVLIKKIDIVLAIEGNLAAVPAVIADANLNLVLTTYHQGAMTQGMRADRDQGDGIQVRVEYRASAGQGIGS